MNNQPTNNTIQRHSLEELNAIFEQYNLSMRDAMELLLSGHNAMHTIQSKADLTKPPTSENYEELGKIIWHILMFQHSENMKAAGG